MHVYKYTKIQGLDSREITSLPEIKKMNTWHVISIIADNKTHVHHKSYLHTMKVCNTRTSQVCLLRIFFFRPLSSVHLFQSNQRGWLGAEYMNRAGSFENT